MRGVLDVDGPVYRVLSRWAELIMLSLIWWLLVLPVVTAPAATGWLLHAVVRTREGESIPRPGEILGHLRRGFAARLRLAGVHLLVAALVLVALLGPSPGGWYGQLVFAVGILVGITAALVVPWSVVLLEEQGTARAALEAAYRRALGRLSPAFLSAVAVAAGAAGVLFAPLWIRLIVLVAAPGLVAAAVSRLCDFAATHRTSFRAPASDAPSPDDHRLREATS